MKYLIILLLLTSCTTKPSHPQIDKRKYQIMGKSGDLTVSEFRELIEDLGEM
jgi:hypothetical protein